VISDITWSHAVQRRSNIVIDREPLLPNRAGESSVGMEALELVSLLALERPSPVSTQSGKQHHPNRVPYHIRLHFYAVIPAVRNGILGVLATLDCLIFVFTEQFV
jgi:hypothetical protein